MKKLEIIKETQDLREGRNKILKVGTKFACIDELAEQYLKKKLAKIQGETIKPRKPLKSIEDAEDYEVEQKNKE